jgi:hypothetical protein
MSDESTQPTPLTLKRRLKAIEALEAELVMKAQATMPAGGAVNVIDFFILGATQRTLSQSTAFRTLIETRNFPSATVLLRTQIDTAMRINGLRFMGDPEADIERILKRERTFDRLMSSPEAGGGKAERLTDAFLKRKLAEEHPWIEPLYEQTSDFVHLSFRHLFTAITKTDSATQIATMAISGTDPKQDESAYYEVCDAFFQVSKLASMSIVGVLMARHRREQVVAAEAARQREDERPT